MLAAGVIEPSVLEWTSPPLLMRKHDKSWRYCIDFRASNSVMERDAYPLLFIEKCIDSLDGMRWLCTLNMNLGYWQIPIEEDKKKTAFLTWHGLFHFLYAFGLSNAPATFQHAMQFVLVGLIWESVIVCLDDISVMGKTFEQSLANLEIVLKRFRKLGLKLKPRKCALYCTEIKFLGRRIDDNGGGTAHHIQMVLDWPRPKTKKELESFLGFMNY